MTLPSEASLAVTEPVAVYRPLRPTDLAYVLRTLLRSLWAASPDGTPTNDRCFLVRGVKKQVFFKQGHQLFTALLARPNAFVVIAADPADEDNIFGFCLGELREGVLVLHWLYVKNLWRGLGLGKALLTQVKAETGNFFYSLRNPLVASYLHQHPDFKPLYSPFLLFFEARQ